MIPERVKVALGILLTGLPKPPAPVNGARMWGVVPSQSPFEDERAAGQRREGAASMLDEDVIGYVLLTVRREFHGPNGAEVRVLHEVARELWPAVNETMRRLARAAREVA